jgi:hypothetical protein
MVEMLCRDGFGIRLGSLACTRLAANECFQQTHADGHKEGNSTSDSARTSLDPCDATGRAVGFFVGFGFRKFGVA